MSATHDRKISTPWAFDVGARRTPRRACSMARRRQIFFEQKTNKNSSKKPAPGPPTPRGGCMCAFCIEIATMIASFRPLGRLTCGFRARCPPALTRTELFHTIAGRRFAFSRGRPSPAAMAKRRVRQTARQAGGCWLGVLKGALSDGSVSGSFCPGVPKIVFYRSPL